jgi:hypothetical protein
MWTRDGKAEVELANPKHLIPAELNKDRWIPNMICSVDVQVVLLFRLPFLHRQLLTRAVTNSGPGLADKSNFAAQ